MADPPSGSAAPLDVGVSAVFALEVDGVTIATFKEIDGLSIGRRSIEYWENSSKGVPIIRRTPGRMELTDINCRRGFTTDGQLWDWWQKVRDGKMTLKDGRRNGSIVLYDLEGKEAARFNFTNGWISKMSISGLEAGTDTPLIEECVITHEDLQKAPGGGGGGGGGGA